MQVNFTMRRFAIHAVALVVFPPVWSNAGGLLSDPVLNAFAGWGHDAARADKEFSAAL